MDLPEIEFWHNSSDSVVRPFRTFLSFLIICNFDDIHYFLLGLYFVVVVFLVRPPYQVENKKEMGVPEVGVSKEGVGLPVQFQDVKYPKFKREI